MKNQPDFTIRAASVIVAILSVFPSCAKAQNCVAPPPGIVSWWQAEGNAYDSIQLVSGLPLFDTYYAQGEVGQAFALYGNEGGVIVGNPSYLQLQNFTIETWEQRRVTDGVSYISSEGVFLGYGTNGYSFGIQDNGLLFLSVTGSNSVTSATAITDTNFHHVAVTMNNGSVVFYVDGKPDPVVAYNVTFSFASICSIGCSGGLNSVFNGNIDELSVYNRALAASEIQSIFNAGPAGKCLEPVIAIQPTNTVVIHGQTAAFQVTALGSLPLYYQWQSNGVAIPAATNAILTVSATAANNNGDNYSVTVSNSVGSIQSTNATLTVETFSCVPPPSGIVGWWQAERNTYDSIQLVAGSVAGNVQYVPGEVGLAFSFDGNSATVNLGVSSNLQLQTFTIEGWIQRGSTTSVGSSDGEFLGYASGGYGFGIHPDGRLLLTQVGNSVVYSATAINDTKFHHVAVTLANGTATFFVDGAADPAVSYPNVTFVFPTSVSIGSAGGGGGFFLGNIDELSVYNRALGVSEIESIFHAGYGGKCLAPVIAGQPASSTALIGGSAVLHVTALGTAPLFYQWQSNGVSLPTATNAFLAISSLSTNYNVDHFSVTVSNVIGSIQSSNATLTVESFNCVPPPSGIVSWWQAESNAYDSIQLADGSLGGNVQYVPGEVGMAFSFDGSTGNVYLGNPRYLQLQTFTIEGWVQRGSATSVSSDPSDGDLVGYGVGGYAFGIHPDGRLVLTQVGDSAVYSTTAITDTNFHDLAVTLAEGTATFFVDGVADPPVSYQNVTFSFGSAISIGSAGGEGGFFLGNIDELSVYNRALGASEIHSIFNASRGGKCFAPVIAAQPPNVITHPGADAVFDVTALGTEPLFYQWKSNGVPISSATDASLVVTATAANNSGDHYTVSVSNRLGSIQSLPGTLISGDFACVPPPPGIVSWWQAEGNPYDAVQLAAGTLIDGAQYVPGEVGMAFSFDGSTGYVNLGNPGYLELQTFTIECWVQRGSATSVGSSDGEFLSYGAGGYGFGIHPDGRLLLTQVGSSVVYSVATISDTKLHHVAVSLADGVATFFLDGVPDPAASYSPGFSFGSTVSIGSAGGVGGFFLGNVDELSVYNRPLEASEIQSIFNAGRNGKCLPPVFAVQPADFTAGIGGTATFTVTALGSAPLSYQWQSNGVPIPGATAATLLVSNASTNNNGDQFNVTASNVLASIQTTNATLILEAAHCVPPRSGIVSWWQAESNAYDSVQLTAGIPVGNIHYVPGEVGMAFSFDGSSGNFNLGNPSYLQLQTFTIEGWVQRGATASVSDGSADGEFLGYGSGGYGFGIHEDGRLLFTQIGGGVVYSATRITDTKFHHLAVTMGNGIVIFYVDGVPDPAISFPGITFTFTSAVSIGSAGGAGAFFLGNIDELTVYSRTLVASEIQSIAAASHQGKCLAPAFAVQPANIDASTGEAAVFDVTAVGTAPLYYQWYSNGVAIPNATNSVLQILNVSTNGNGAHYNVIVSNVLASAQSAFATLMVGGFTCIPPPSGIVSCWQAQGNPFDSIQLASGIVMGNVGYVPGEVGLAFSFDGSSANVNLGSPSYLQLQAFTIEGWIQRSNTTSVGSSDGEFLGYGGGGYGFGIHPDGRLLLTQVGSGVVYSAAGITDTNFHHVAVTLTNGIVTFFLDGAPDPPVSYGPVFSFGSTLSIGSAGGGGGFFLGNIDELSIYNRALSELEIQSIFSSGTNGKCLMPAIARQPVNYTTVNGLTAFFSASGVGTLPLFYQWQTNGANIPNATNSSLFLGNLTTNDNGKQISVTLSNSLGSVQGSNATLTLESFPCVPPPAGMVSWWAANGNALDMTGNNSGTLIGGTAYAVGEEGDAFVFANAGDAVFLGNPASLQLQNFTIEAWIRRASASQASPTPGGGVFLGYGNFGYAFGINDSGTLYLSLVGQNEVASSATVTDTNQFHHVAVTTTNGTVVFYIDGVGSSPTKYAQVYQFNTPVEIGASGSGSSTFIGEIDDLTVYNRALSSNEIAEIAAAGAGEKCAVPPTITVQPLSQDVVQGSNAILNVVINTDLAPTIQWNFNGEPLSAATNSTLELTNFQSNQAGTYTVLVNNALGGAASSNAVLSLIPGNPLILVNGQAAFTNVSTNFATVKIESTFTNETVFYTVDGSEPDFGSTPYDGIFTLTQSAIIRAIAYDTNFNFVESPEIYLNLWFDLTLTNLGGGTVSFNPPGGVYPSGQTVQLTATPSNAWLFLQWAGAASGANPVVNVPMTNAQTVMPVFGTAINFTQPTNGSIQTIPALPAFAFGSTVQLNAFPDPGYYFGLWGGSASGNASSYLLQILSPNPSVAALFGALPPGHFSLTVIPNGAGTVSAHANSYASNEVVSLLATGAQSNSFYYWSGDATGTANPLTVTVNTNMIITANFLGGVYPVLLSVSPTGGVSVNFSLSGVPQQLYDIQTSSNLLNWSYVFTVSNSTGTAYFSVQPTNPPLKFYRAQSH